MSPQEQQRLFKEREANGSMLLADLDGGVEKRVRGRHELRVVKVCGR